MSNVFVFAEARAGDLRKIALEAVSAARALADSTGGEVHALLAGAAGIESRAERLAQHGADVVYVAEHEGFTNYNGEALAALVTARLTAGGYRAAIFGASVHGRDLAPRVAAKLGAGIVSDVVKIDTDGDAIVARHPVNTGKVIATVRVTGEPVLLTVRPAMFTPVESARTARIEKIQPEGDPSASKVVVTELKQGTSSKLDLSEAPVVIAGGRGLRAAENFKLVEDLADAFGNAAVGCTRAVSDDGWRPHSDQIGQTGRLVSPDLYIAVGISGAIQHLAGMRTSRTIVAINRDKEAPIFQLADYGIVGDAFEIMPPLTEAVRKAREG
jgi:electron transfer flavoprotein alpha subunit